MATWHLLLQTAASLAGCGPYSMILALYLHRADVSNGKIALLQIPASGGIQFRPSGEDVQRGFSALAAGQTIYAGFDVSASGNDNRVVFARFVWPDE